MATKSPGIYYTEKDNTYYSNPKAAIGTTLAIIGFANKGPIDKPVEINSWKGFIDTFGESISGKYSGLAIKNYLAAGGTVLFKRVIDTELAKPSSYIIKNGVKAKAAYSYFNKKGDILSGSPEYNGGSLYGFKVNDGVSPSNIIVRSPKKGLRFTQQSIVKQITDQLGGVNSSYEGKLGNVGVEGIYSFKLVSDEDNKEFYINTNEKNSSKKAFVEKLSKRLTTTNAVVKIDVFSAKAGSGETYAIEGEKRFYFTREESQAGKQAISVKLESSDTTLASIVKKINVALSGTDIVALVQGNSIYFVDMIEESPYKLTISCDEIDPLFANTDSGSSGFPVLEEDSVALYASTNTSTAPASVGKIKSISYDEVTESVIITATDEVKSIKLVNVAEKGASDFIGKSSIITKELFTKKQNSVAGIKVYVDSNKQIRLEFEDASRSSLTIEKIGELEKSDNPIEIFDFLPVMENVTSVGNKAAIEDSQKDLIVITSKELGKGTTDITVEVVSMVNPLNEKDVTRKLFVYSDGIIKETFENIIVDSNSDNSFDKVINKTPEEGGSYYVNILVVKNNEDPDIDLPLNGIWKLGQKNKEDDKMFDGADNDYYKYEYAVGNNGIPEDGGDYLFLTELDTIESDLANKELYDFHIVQTPDNNSVDVQNARISLCESRGDAFTIIDPPEGLTKKEVINWHNGIGRDTPVDSNYAAVYWPWCKVFDTTSGTGKYAWVMPSLVMAPLYARVDKTVGSQAAPAGENNGILPVIDIERYPSATDRDELYVNYNRINPLVKFKDGTVLAYGEKTTQRKESVLTKIHTRRMLIQIKKQCREALRGYLFEPNTADYLGKISNNITAILEGYKSNGGLNFYKVVCDETNNPIEIRQQDIINVDVALVPQGTIEQININLTLNKSEETVSD